MKLLLMSLLIFCSSWVLSNGHNDTSCGNCGYLRARSLSDKAYKYSTINIDSSLSYARKALAISEKFRYDRIKAFSLSDIGKAYMSLEVFDSASHYLKKSLALRQRLGVAKHIVSGYNNLGKLYQRKCNYDSAIVMFEKGMRLAKEKSSIGFIPTLLNGLGVCYLNKEDYKQAEEFLLKALKEEEKKASPNYLGERYQNLATLYAKTGRPNQALGYLELAKMSYDSLNNIEGTIDVLINQGAVHQSQGLLEEAVIEYETALDLSEINGFLDNRLSIINNLGLVYTHLRRYGEAQRRLKEGMELANADGKSKGYSELAVNYVKMLIYQSDFDAAKRSLIEFTKTMEGGSPKRVLAEYHLMQSQVYAALGDYDSAYIAHKAFIHIRDDLDKVIDVAQASLAQMERDKRDKIILQKENALQATELEKQIAQNKMQWLGISALLLFLVGSIVVLTMRLRHTKLKNTALKEKKKSEEKLKNLLSQVDIQLLETQLETNRATSYRIGQDLHDNLGSKLAVAQMSMGGIKTKVGIVSEDISDRFDEVEKLLEDSCKDLRTIAHDLQDRELKYRGLVKELDEYLGLIREARGLQVRFIPEGFPEQINEKAQKGIIAIIRLLIENVLRHAEAQEISIIMKLDRNHFFIEVIDNGKGFIENENQEGKGLKNAKERAERLGGTFSITSKPTEGTAALLTLPIDNL